MTPSNYLLSYGKAGDFGLFQASFDSSFRRGERLVIRSQRGLELGTVLRPAAEGHVEFLAGRYVGNILRPAGPADDATAACMAERSQEIYQEGRRLTAECRLPMEILDAELLLDGKQAILHHLRWEECDPRPLMGPLSDRFKLLITLHDLALPSVPEDEPAGCGSPGCGHSTGGGCGSCSSGGCGTCGSAATHSHETVQGRHPLLAYLAK